MTDYKLLVSQLEALTEGVDDEISNLANAAALLYMTLPDINWAGFYILKDGLLKLGPFMGKPACVRIGIGKGVCGTAAARGETIVVPDVHAFPGHIACDADSASEIVIPLYSDGKLFGVLDIDSPVQSRFTADDAEGLEAFAAALDRTRAGKI